jgi:hypothetical protein
MVNATHFWRAQLGLTPPNQTSPWVTEFPKKLDIFVQLFLTEDNKDIFSIPGDTRSTLGKEW